MNVIAGIFCEAIPKLDVGDCFVAILRLHDKKGRFAQDAPTQKLVTSSGARCLTPFDMTRFCPLNIPPRGMRSQNDSLDSHRLWSGHAHQVQCARERVLGGSNEFQARARNRRVRRIRRDDAALFVE